MSRDELNNLIIELREANGTICTNAMVCIEKLLAGLVARVEPLDPVQKAVRLWTEQREEQYRAALHLVETTKEENQKLRESLEIKTKEYGSMSLDAQRWNNRCGEAKRELSAEQDKSEQLASEVTQLKQANEAIKSECQNWRSKYTSLKARFSNLFKELNTVD